MIIVILYVFNSFSVSITLTDSVGLTFNVPFRPVHPGLSVFSGRCTPSGSRRPPPILQIGVATRTPEELEPVLFHVPAYGVGFRRRGRNLAERPERVDDGLSFWKEREDIIAETPELFLHGKEQPRVGNRRSDFQTVFHNTIEPHQPLDVLVCHPHHTTGIEFVESFPVPFPFAEYGYPIQSCLCALQHEKIEHGFIVRHWLSPLAVVVARILFVRAAPAAASVYNILHHFRTFLPAKVRKNVK